MLSIKLAPLEVIRLYGSIFKNFCRGAFGRMRERQTGGLINNFN